MNPLYKALNGGSAAYGAGMGNVPSGMAGSGFGGILGQMQRLAGMMQNPQALVRNYFPDAPAEVSGNPEQLLQWMQQTGKVNPQMVQMARQMMRK